MTKAEVCNFEMCTLFGLSFAFVKCAVAGVSILNDFLLKKVIKMVMLYFQRV